MIMNSARNESVFQRGFRQLDRVPDLQTFVGYLQSLSATAWARQYKEHVLGLLALQQGQDVLEIGCGLGEDAVTMAKRVQPNGRTVAIDNSRQMIEEARRRSSLPVRMLEFMVADAQALPFADGTFDVCHADRVFQHLDTPNTALAELVRVVRAGGTIAICEPVTTIAYMREDREIESTEPGEEPSAALMESLPDMLRQLGVADIELARGPSRVLDPQAILKSVTQRDPSSSSAASAWHDDLVRRNPHCKPVAVLTASIVLARCPT